MVKHKRFDSTDKLGLAWYNSLKDDTAISIRL
jgi:hypothetical protein